MLILAAALLPLQKGYCECAQPGGECGGSPFKDCCDKTTHECRSIYDDKEVITKEKNEIGECKEKAAKSE